MTIYQAIREKLENVLCLLDEVEKAAKDGDSRDELGWGMQLLDAYCLLMTFLYTNTNEAYRPHLKASMKVDDSVLIDELGRQMAKKMYEGKYFYEILKKNVNDDMKMEHTLVGPIENLYYLRDGTGFVQVIDGKPVARLSNDEVLVTDRKL